MEIVVPSAGRAGKLKCLDFLRTLEAPLSIAVPEREAEAYERAYPTLAILPVPSSVQGISGTRQWVTDRCEVPYLLQVSDDVKFFRRNQETLKLTFATAEDMQALERRILELVTQYGHAGVSMRTKNVWWPEPVYICSKRMCDVYAHDVELLRATGVRWDRLPVMEDMDVTVSLIRMGYPHAVIYEWCWDQPGSNMEGGCSTYRTPELQMEGALRLEHYHHPFVRARRKKANNWEGFGGERWDVTVQWQRALKAARGGLAPPKAKQGELSL